jgi:hypothetical protein
MRLLAAVAACAAALGHAAENEWEFLATGYWNAPRGGDAYASGIVTAGHGALHLEARANYEAVHSQSAFIGWTFSFGDAVKVEATPIVGFAGNALRGPIAGVEASIAAGKFDYYIEAEYVRDRSAREASYTYAWSEFGYRPVEALRLGLAVQRTRIYGGDRDFQTGPFAQFSWGKATLGAYLFNPGSSEQVVIVSLGAAF